MFQVSSSVVKLYRDEMNLTDGAAIQLYVRYTGGTSGGYGLGIDLGRPKGEDFKKSVDGITFFVKPDDQWFMENMDLDYDRSNDMFICKSPAIT
jgi:uncharacterized protein YneR